MIFERNFETPEVVAGILVAFTAIGLYERKNPVEICPVQSKR